MSKLVAQSASFLANLGTVRCTMLLINSMSLKSVNSFHVRWSPVTQSDLYNQTSNKSSTNYPTFIVGDTIYVIADVSTTLDCSVYRMLVT